MENRLKWYAPAAVVTGVSMLIGACTNPKKDIINPSLLPNPQVEPSPTPDLCSPEFVKQYTVVENDTVKGIIDKLTIVRGDYQIIGQGMIIASKNHLTLVSGKNAFIYGIDYGLLDDIYPDDHVYYGENGKIQDCFETFKSKYSPANQTRIYDDGDRLNPDYSENAEVRIISGGQVESVVFDLP